MSCHHEKKPFSTRQEKAEIINEGVLEMTSASTNASGKSELRKKCTFSSEKKKTVCQSSRSKEALCRIYEKALKK